MSNATPQDEDGNRTCDYGTNEDCNDDAVAIYEGIDPPAGTIRYAACNDHTPDDLPPIRWISNRLVTDGGERPTEGTLYDTYHAALQHSHDEPDKDDIVIGVVREQMYGIQKYIDVNWPELAPPRELLDEFKTKADEIGHNAAVDAVNFRERYRNSLNGQAQEKISEIVNELQSGRNVWVVCYENTDDKFCHREILTTEIMRTVNSNKNQ